MNEMAAQLGLTNTHYADPSGLDVEQRLVGLRHVAPDRVRRVGRALGPIMRTRRVRGAHERRGRFTIHSTNKLLGTDVDVRGGKTGFISKAGYCLATLLQVPQGSQVAVVVLGAANSATRFWEARHLFNWVVGRAQGMVGGDADAVRTSTRISEIRRSIRGAAAVDCAALAWTPVALAVHVPSELQIPAVRRLHILMVASEARRGRRPAAWPTSSARCRRRSTPRPSTSPRRCRATAASSRRRASASTAPRDASARARTTSRCTWRRCRARRRVVFVDCAGASSIATGSTATGGRDYPDNAERFAVLAAAALDFARSDDATRPVDVVHAHDWQAGLVPVLAARRAAALAARSRGAGLVFTIHNLAYQGLFPRDVGAGARPAVGRLHAWSAASSGASSAS